MKDEKKFLIPEAIIVLFEGALDTMGESGGDLGDEQDPDNPLFPGW